MKLVGQTLLDRFRVETYIATGGMSVVYRVWDLERNVYLAMKVLHADLLDDPKALLRFEREARALQKLAHPHIVPFYGLYRTEEIVFMVEKYVDGLSLKDLLRQRQGALLPNSDILIYLKALCTALGYAHNNGVVHCDVKPGNVMIDRSGNIFLTDFGVARHAESTTTTIGAAGTPAYMAPEQIRGEPVTAETDVYALGIILYEMLTGRRPFAGTESGSESSGGTAAERVRFAHLSLAPVDPCVYNSEITDSLAAIVLRALEKDPRNRYRTTTELLNAVCDGLGTTPDSVPESVSAPELPTPILQAATVKKRPWLLITITGIISALCLCAAVFLTIRNAPAVIAYFVSPTPTSTWSPTPSPTATFTPTSSSTDTPTITPTFTQAPTDTAVPTVPRPTSTQRPTEIPHFTKVKVFVHNRCPYAISVYIGNSFIPTIPSNQYRFIKNIDPGETVVKWCGSGGNCREKTFNIQPDANGEYKIIASP